MEEKDDSVIVFLDDDPHRAALQFNRMNNRDRGRTFWVQTVPETIDMLETYRERLDIVSLDHDLGGKVYVHSAREDCGMEIVRWLEAANPEDYSHVRLIVHSWNIPAGMKMASRLIKSGYRVLRVPFGSSE